MLKIITLRKMTTVYVLHKSIFICLSENTTYLDIEKNYFEKINKQKNR